jgi:hypothetical protein
MPTDRLKIVHALSFPAEATQIGPYIVAISSTPHKGKGDYPAGIKPRFPSGCS